MFAELTITGVSAVALTMAITQKLKAKTNLDPEVVSIVVGMVLGLLGWLYVEGVPTGLESAIAMAFYVLGAGFMPSGAYELGEDLARK